MTHDELRAVVKDLQEEITHLRGRIGNLQTIAEVLDEIAKEQSTASERRNRLGPWHRWFAWYPVITMQHGRRWLRTVERALYYPPDIRCAPDPYWVYRPTNIKKCK